MVFNSIDFLVFFPIVVLLYFIFPQKIRRYWLLVASYYFYMSWNIKYGLLIFFTTVITYLCGIAIQYVNNHTINNKQGMIKRLILVLSISINLGLLFYFKYVNFAINSVNSIFQKIGSSIEYKNADIILPIGISFFIFQAIGYTIDVYRDQIKAEKNLFTYALFVAFFPQLVAGPIERSRNLLVQLKEGSTFNVDNAKNGLLTIAYGLFVKIAVADRIGATIDPIFNNMNDYSGMAVLFAVSMFAIQIYCDFNGYTQIAIGTSRVLGYKLNQNFDTPYMATSVSDFWRRWHISLTSWFRDYLYIPLGGNRKGIIMKYRNTILVFLCSGLWHGAAWHYVVWGGLNGLFIVLEDFFNPWIEKVNRKLSIDKERFMYKVFQRIRTFILITFTWLFFRMDSFRGALRTIWKIKEEFRLEWFINLEFANLFESKSFLLFFLVSLIVIIIIDSLKFYGKDVKAAIFNQQIIFRWIIYVGIFFALIYLGYYGTEYEQTQFIYFQF